MKKLIPIFCVLFLAVSCNKEETNENICPTITRESISTNALNHFDSTYTGASNVVWFNVDSQSICAVFDLNNAEYEVKYNNEGVLISTEAEMDTNQKGNHKDSDYNDNCECDRDDEGED